MYRYIGNKTKLVDEIINKIKATIGNTGTVADLMAGTGCISKALHERGYNVITSDVMTYSKYHLLVEIGIKIEPDFQGLKDIFIAEKRYPLVIKYLNDLEPKESYFFREYAPSGSPQNGSPARKYFTDDNAKKIDAIRDMINNWIVNDKINEQEEALLKHSLIMAANEVANISGTFGYFLKDFSKSAMGDIALKEIDFEKIQNKGTSTVVYQGYAEEVSKNISADLCYIDPPYMKRQYAANYHILETLAVGDYPNDLIGKSGMRNWWTQYSDFCTKTKGLNAFKKIFENMKCKNFLISYSEDGLFSIRQLEDFFTQFGNVEIDTISYQRFKSNKSKLPHDINEYLISIRR